MPADDKWVKKFLQPLGDGSRGVGLYAAQLPAGRARISWLAPGGATAAASVGDTAAEMTSAATSASWAGTSWAGRRFNCASARLRTFYRFLVRQGALAASPIRNLALPKLGKRLPKFLTPQQMADLLAAPLKLLPAADAEKAWPAGRSPPLPGGDVAILETTLLLRPAHQRAVRVGGGRY